LGGTTLPRQDLRNPDTRDAAGPVGQDLRSPDARDAANAEQIARMLEPYYSSYGEPQTVKAPAPAVPDNDSPWMLISVIAGGLALVLASAALIMRRRRPATV
jgi:hypothetical protein